MQPARAHTAARSGSFCNAVTSFTIDAPAARAASATAAFDVSIETGIPVSFGVLTVDSVEQGEARVFRAADAVRTALEMADVFAQLRASARPV